MAETKSESSSKRVSFATTDEIIEPGVHAPLDVLLDPKLATHTEDKVDKSNGTHEPAKVVGENVDEVSDMFKSITKNESVSGSADKESSTTEAEVTDMFKGLSKKKKKSKKAGDEIPAQPASDEDPLPSSTTEKKEEEITNMFEGLAKKKKKLKKAGDDVPAQPASAEDPLPSPTTEKKEEEVTNMFEGLSKKKKNSKKAGDEISAQPAPAEYPLPSLTTEEKGGEVTNIFEGLSKKKKKSKKFSNEIPGEPASTEDPLPSSTTGGKEEEDLSTDPTKKKKKKSIKVEDDTSAEPARTLSADPQTADAPAPEPKIITDDEVTDMFKGLAKKKKAKRADKKSKSAEPTEAELEAGPDGEGEEEGGDPDEGTGIWNHNAKKDLKYGQLLDRFFQILQDKNPDMMSGKVKSYKIPPPQCVREGNKKTIFANIADICNRMDRSDEHVTSYLFAELGTNGSVDGSRRLVIKGRFQQKQIENVLRRYIVEYVTCKTCRSQSTAFSKGDHRLYYVTCNSCSSSRSVTTIKTGFTAQIGKRKKMQA